MSKKIKPCPSCGAETAPMPLVFVYGHFKSKLIAQELEINLENGGFLDLKLRRNSLGECLNGLRDMLPTLALDDMAHLEVTFRYWQLTEDLQSLEIKISEADYSMEDRLLSPAHTVNRLLVLAKTQFLKRLAINQIRLHGPEGKLEVYD